MRRMGNAASRKHVLGSPRSSSSSIASPNIGHPANPPRFLEALVLSGLALITTNLAAASDEDKKTVAALDTQYQAAVENNDADTMARIHADGMILVLSNGTVQTGAFLEKRARDKVFTWEHQVEVDNSQVVRVWGDTAVVTAKLWLKGTRVNGEPVDFKLWFSDTYARTPAGWRYVFGQAGAPLKE